MLRASTCALVLALAALTAGCGGGGAGDQVAAQPKTAAQTAPAASTSTAAKAAPKASPAHARKPKAATHAGRHKARRAPGHKAAPRPTTGIPAAVVRRARRHSMDKMRASFELARLCPKAGSVPRPPSDSTAMPSYARRVLPTARRHVAELRRARTQLARRRVQQLAGLYSSAIPFLQRLARPSTSKDEVKALSRPALSMVAAVSRAATGAGIPRCGLPSGS